VIDRLTRGEILLTLSSGPYLTTPTPVQGPENTMFSSFRPGPLFSRQARRRGPYNVTQALLRSDNCSRSSLEYRRPLSSSHSEHDNPQRPPKSVIPILGVAVASAFLGYGLAKSSALGLNTGGTNTNNKFGSPEDIKTAINELRAVLAEAQVSTDPGDLQVHGFSANDHHQGLFLSPPTCHTDPNCMIAVGHSVVVYPESTEDVVKIVKIATRFKIPITAYSGATSLEGHYRGVCLSLP